ncbi:MAG: non-ribosomal peptide synthetase [Pseudomonadota bacterium]
MGRPINDVALRIVDDSGGTLADGRVGHIQLKGGSVTSGIYGDPEVTKSLFSDDGWLHTGDCGAMIEGELVVTGRQKDLIIVNGQNYLPHDLEDLLSTLPGLDLNKVVVASAPIIGGEERERILVFVLHRGDTHLPDEMRDAVIRRLGEQVGLQVDHVIPVARIPKTTSGKVQRAALVRQFTAGEFDDLLVVTDEAELVEDDDPLVASLLQICAEHAKDVKIGADDNLFEVGVSSLTLSEIVLGIDERFPGQLDISDLFDVPSIREVAQFLRDKGHSG